MRLVFQPNQSSQATFPHSQRILKYDPCVCVCVRELSVVHCTSKSCWCMRGLCDGTRMTYMILLMRCHGNRLKSLLSTCFVYSEERADPSYRPLPWCSLQEARREILFYIHISRKEILTGVGLPINAATATVVDLLMTFPNFQLINRAVSSTVHNKRNTYIWLFGRRAQLAFHSVCRCVARYKHRCIVHT